MTTLRYNALRSPTNTEVHVDPRLLTCSHVFVRHEATRKPLDRPIKVVSRFKKHFILDYRTHHDSVSIYRF